MIKFSIFVVQKCIVKFHLDVIFNVRIFPCQGIGCWGQPVTRLFNLYGMNIVMMKMSWWYNLCHDEWIVLWWLKYMMNVNEWCLIWWSLMPYELHGQSMLCWWSEYCDEMNSWLNESMIQWTNDLMSRWIVNWWVEQTVVSGVNV